MLANWGKSAIIILGKEAEYVFQGGIYMASLNSLNSVAGMFASMNSGSTGTNSIYNMDFSTYNSIRSGSYSKLLKSYYSDDDKRTATKDAFSSGMTDSATEKNNATVSRDSAAALVDSVKDLRSSSLWEEKEKTDKDGNKTSEYDMDEIYKAVSSFKDNYNSLVTSTGKSSDKSTLNAASNMVNYTRANASILKKIGVSVDSDNKLSIDEDKFKKSDISSIKSVFSGAGSFAQSTSASASSVYGSAVSQLSKLQTQNSYTSTGSYSYVPVSNYNSFT